MLASYEAIGSNLDVCGWFFSCPSMMRLFQKFSRWCGWCGKFLKSVAVPFLSRKNDACLHFLLSSVWLFRKNSSRVWLHFAPLEERILLLLKGATAPVLAFQWFGCTLHLSIDRKKTHLSNHFSLVFFSLGAAADPLSMVRPSPLWLSAFSPSLRAENPLKGVIVLPPKPSAIAPPPQPKIPNFPIVWMVRLHLIPLPEWCSCQFLSPMVRASFLLFLSSNIFFRPAWFFPQKKKLVNPITCSSYLFPFLLIFFLSCNRLLILSFLLLIFFLFWCCPLLPFWMCVCQRFLTCSCKPSLNGVFFSFLSDHHFLFQLNLIHSRSIFLFVDFFLFSLPLPL